MINKMFRRNKPVHKNYDEYTDSCDDMEAGYDEIEAEERRTARIAA